MISREANLTIQRVPIRRMVIDEVRARSLDWVQHYTLLLTEQPTKDAGLLCLEPLGDGYYVVVDGQTRFLASIIAGREEALCLIIEEPKEQE